MDVLSDVMRAVRMSGAVFFNVFAGERVLAMTPPMCEVGHQVMPGAGHVIPFHIMLRGHCWVEMFDGRQEPVRLEEGDFIFYPHGDAHIFVSEIGDRIPAEMALYSRPSGVGLPIALDLVAEERPATRFVCGYLGCDAGPFNPLLEALPSQVLAKRPAEGNHIEVDLIASAVEESDAQRAGSETILAKLSELLFVRVLRRYIENLPDHSAGWLASLRDPQINRALQAMHGAPAQDWTLEALAREAGLSRAVFAERFAACVGETPMKYLAKWRMQLATTLLATPGIPIEAVGERVGYKSEAAFSRAFKAIVGTPPGAWRRARH